MTAHGPPRPRTALLVSPGSAGPGDPWGALVAPLTAALPAGWRVAHAACDAPTALAAAVRGLAADDPDDLVVVLLHPQFRTRLLAPIVQATYATLAECAPHVSATLRTAWHDDAGYVQALAAPLAARIEARPPHAPLPHVRFTVAGPAEAGDHRFARQVRRTAELVAARLGLPPGGWEVATADGTDGGWDAADTIVVPLPFPADPTPATTAGWVGVLRHLVLHGPQPATDPEGPLLAGRPAGTDVPASLTLLGACLGSSLGPGDGPALRYSDPRAFAGRPHSRKLLRGCLDRLRAAAPDCELLLWTTCQRVELYAWIPDGEGPAARANLEDRLRQLLFGPSSDGIAVNVLRDRAARHHFARTACGLNSGLPGDRDVMAQLLTALHMADAAGTAGPRAHALVDEAVRLAHTLHAAAPWGRFSMGYCAAALTRICEVDGLCFDRLRHLVIGGSTTSRAVLSTLVEEHRVPHRQLTLVYRDHHGQMRQLRAALGSGRRLRVHRYDDAAVLRAIGDAELVVFGVDQTEPVLDAAALAGAHEARGRPFIVVDFNASGSLAGSVDPRAVRLWSAHALDRAVAAQAAVTISRSGFAAALADAEARIARALAERIPGDGCGAAPDQPAPGVSAGSAR